MMLHWELWMSGWWNQCNHFVLGERVCWGVSQESAVAVPLLLRELMPLHGSALCRNARWSGAILGGSNVSVQICVR